MGTYILPAAWAFQVAPAQVGQNSLWWAAFGLGEGELKLSSDQQQGKRVATFALAVAGGYQVNDRVRVGLHLNGWLLQASNLNDPTVGEGVSTETGIVDVFPARKTGLFLRGGGGLVQYTNNRPTGVSGSGPAWETGGGYEISVKGRFWLVPTAEYSSGRLGDANGVGSTQTGRRYSVVDFKLAALCRFGRRKR